MHSDRETNSTGAGAQRCTHGIVVTEPSERLLAVCCGFVDHAPFEIGIASLDVGHGLAVVDRARHWPRQAPVLWAAVAAWRVRANVRVLQRAAHLLTGRPNQNHSIRWEQLVQLPSHHFRDARLVQPEHRAVLMVVVGNDPFACLADEASLKCVDHIRVGVQHWCELCHMMIQLLPVRWHVVVQVLRRILAEHIIVVHVHNRLDMEFS